MKITTIVIIIGMFMSILIAADNISAMSIDSGWAIGIKISVTINPKDINPKSEGNVKITIDNKEIDINTINVSDMKFGNAPVIKSKKTNQKLILFFNIQDIGIRCGDTEKKLIGYTYNNVEITSIVHFNTTGCR